jgi:hypothetical protein
MTLSAINAKPWVIATTAGGDRVRALSPAKKSEVPQNTLEARASKANIAEPYPGVPRPDQETGRHTLWVVDSRNVLGEDSTEFAQALRDLRAVRLRPEVRLTEVPAPSRIAPYAVAMAAEVISSGGQGGGDEIASGRFVLLYDPSEPEPWDGVWRAVTFARAVFDPELANDPMLGAVGWSWLKEALDHRGADHVADGGTVTRVVSESFAGLADRGATVEMEIRASWTPTGPNLGVHLQAWADLLCTVAGLPPLPDGVTALPRPRR